jgi:hypothetical protein
MLATIYFIPSSLPISYINTWILKWKNYTFYRLFCMCVSPYRKDIERAFYFIFRSLAAPYVKAVSTFRHTLEFQFSGCVWDWWKKWTDIRASQWEQVWGCLMEGTRSFTTSCTRSATLEPVYRHTSSSSLTFALNVVIATYVAGLEYTTPQNHVRYAYWPLKRRKNTCVGWSSLRTECWGELFWVRGRK